MRKITLIFLAFVTTLSLQTANAADAINYSDTEEPLIDLLSLTNQKLETSNSNNKFQVTVTASDNLNKLERNIKTFLMIALLFLLLMRPKKFKIIFLATP